MAQGELTSAVLTEAYLPASRTVDSKVGSYIAVTAEIAREAATTRRCRSRTGLRRGPLHGIPFALKDIYETAGSRRPATRTCESITRR